MLMKEWLESQAGEDQDGLMATRLGVVVEIEIDEIVMGMAETRINEINFVEIGVGDLKEQDQPRKNLGNIARQKNSSQNDCGCRL